MIERFLSFCKFVFNLNPKFNNFILKLYFRSIFYRKKHIKKNNYNWLKNIEIFNLNDKEGLLKFENFQFYLLKNDIKAIPLHQKYLYASLINYIKIPKYYLLFWDDIIVFREIFIEKSYEKEFIVKKGDVILDIGASIGWYSCKMSDLVGETGKIIAIEPNPDNFYYLKKNIEKNNLKNIIPLNIGVWSSKRKMNLTSNKYGSLLEYLQKSDDLKYCQSKINVELNTIDNIVLDLKLEKINLIKMDIEGAEIEAIKGAKNALTRSKNICLIFSAYHKDISGIESYRTLFPILKKMKFKIFNEYLPFIYAQKSNRD